MAKSKAPSGLGITRSGNKFICTWHIPSAKYGDGQKFKATTVSATDISKTAEKKTVTIALANRYPNGSKLTAFSFSVKGNTDGDKGWSDWTKKEITLTPPKAPTITTELTGENVCKFSWTVPDVANDNKKPFNRVQIQTKLVKDCTWSPAEDSWSGATEETSANSSGEKEITESSATLATGNYTRLVRIRAQGCAGDSEWTYAKKVYGASKQAEQTEGETQETSGGYDVLVNWDTPYDESTPIDQTVVEWTIATPESDMSCPSGATWNTGRTLVDTEGAEAAHVTITSRLAADQCLWTRVNTVHDSITTYGQPVLQKVGTLSTPSGLSVENVDQDAQTAKITATNASSVSGSTVAVIYRLNGQEMIVGLITGSPNYVTVKVPAWTSSDSVSFGVKAVLPSSTSSSTSDGITFYTIESYMESAVLWQSGTVAVAPSGVSLSRDGEDVVVSWVNNWSDANIVELSWSDNPNAWESTDDPEFYQIDNPFATKWRIAGLETGTTWYVKVRSIYDSGDGKSYSPYSSMAEINLASSPSVPVLSLSSGIISISEGFTASWEYQSTDGTDQSEARIYEYDNGAYTELGRVLTQEHIDLPGWDAAGSHLLCVEVVSASGQTSDKSELMSITVAEPVTCSVASSLETVTVTDDDDTTRQVTALTALPMTITVTGAGTGATTAVTIRRSESYFVERPDEDETQGFEGETIFDTSQIGEAQISIGLEDLIGSLDDGADYEIVARVIDNIGQTAEVVQGFTVLWTHQALMPEGTVIIDGDDKFAVLKPIAPTGALQTDTCDIYRLSADKPVLVYKGAAFGSDYVDPYPAIGVEGGYRFVYMTANGDYNMADNVLAMYDNYDALLDINYAVIDFDDGRVELKYDLNVSSQWDKPFETKRYLGGSVKGYWQKGVERSGDISAVSIPSTETEAIATMRRLSEYTGTCHVRTPEGSSFPADVQVSEDWDSGKAGKVVDFKLKITRTDQQEPDGMTYDEWIGA